jgi:hypothetical protein
MHHAYLTGTQRGDWAMCQVLSTIAMACSRQSRNKIVWLWLLHSPKSARSRRASGRLIVKLSGISSFFKTHPRIGGVQSIVFNFRFLFITLFSFCCCSCCCIQHRRYIHGGCTYLSPATCLQGLRSCRFTAVVRHTVRPSESCRHDVGCNTRPFCISTD